MLCVGFATSIILLLSVNHEWLAVKTLMNLGGSVTVEFLDYIRVRERMNTSAVGSFLTLAPPHYRPLHTFPPVSYSKEP
jgi:hypothetical protein